MEIGEAPPAADEASRFRGSGTIGAPDRRGNRNAATVTSEFTILIFSVPAGTEFCEAAVKWKSVADFYPQGVRGIRKAAKLPTAAQDCRARQQINLNRFFGATCACQKTLLAPQSTVTALRFPRLFGVPIVPLPRNRFASSAAGGASPVSVRAFGACVAAERIPFK